MKTESLCWSFLFCTLLWGRNRCIMLSYSLTSPTGQRTRHLWVSELDLSAWCQGVSLHRLTFNNPITDLWSLSDGPLPSSGAKTPACQTAQCDPDQDGTWNVITMKMSRRLAHWWLSISVHTRNQLLAARTRPRTTPEERGAEPEGEIHSCSRGLALFFLINGDWEDDIAMRGILVIADTREMKTITGALNLTSQKGYT